MPLPCPHADRLYITEVETEIDGDAFFPNFDESKFPETEARDLISANEKNEHAFHHPQAGSPRVTLAEPCRVTRSNSSEMEVRNGF